MAKSKSTPMQSMKPTQSLPITNCVFPQAELLQLGPPYHAVLAPRQLCQSNLHIPRLRRPVYMAGFRRLGFHTSTSDRKGQVLPRFI